MSRVCLDITGRLPTAEQVKTFLDSKGTGKRRLLIDELLASENFGQQLGRVWLVLLGQRGRRFASQLPDPLVSARQAAFNRAVSLMQSNRAKAFELDEEPAKLREAYGDHKFGKA